MNVEKVYVIHSSVLTERKKHMDSFLGLYNIDAEYILRYDQSDITDEMIKESYLNSEEFHNDTTKKIYTGTAYRRMNMAEISLFFKQREAMRRLVDSGSDYALILEDDIIAVNDFDKK